MNRRRADARSLRPAPTGRLAGWRASSAAWAVPRRQVEGPHKANIQGKHFVFEDRRLLRGAGPPQQLGGGWVDWEPTHPPPSPVGSTGPRADTVVTAAQTRQRKKEKEFPFSLSLLRESLFSPSLSPLREIERERGTEQALNTSIHPQIQKYMYARKKIHEKSMPSGPKPHPKNMTGPLAAPPIISPPTHSTRR